jgi:hypothetical protein
MADLPDAGVQLSRTGLAVCLSASRAERLSMRPLRPAVLVAVEVLGVAAKVAGEGLRGRHRGCNLVGGRGGEAVVVYEI